MNTKSVILLSSFSLLFSAATAFADGKAKGMSQLDFDRPAPVSAAPRNPTGDQINQILAEEAEAKAQSEKAPTKAAAVNPAGQSAGKSAGKEKADTTVRASLDLPPAAKAATASIKFDWEKPAEGTSHYLVPRLKGPSVDGDNDQLITTSASWRRTSALACQDIVDGEALCNKAKALKEVMKRFSGSDEFFDTQCPQGCPSEEQVAVLTAFAVKTVPEGEFRMHEKDKICRYQIKANSDPARWQMLQGERGVCSCLPKSCL